MSASASGWPECLTVLCRAAEHHRSGRDDRARGRGRGGQTLGSSWCYLGFWSRCSASLILAMLLLPLPQRVVMQRSLLPVWGLWAEVLPWRASTRVA